MKLSRFTLKNIIAENIVVPDEALFELPEKVLQFGTGVLLRGLPDYFIDKANRQGVFNGRIVVVKSTSQGDASAFDKQDGLYTVCVRGIQDGQKIEANIINSSISRVLSASEEWEQILECAHNQSMQVIISNTTEVGIQLVNDDIRRHPPVSFPGKLLAFLYERFKAFGGSERSGMVIVPTELISDNGKKLESIVLELAHLNGLEEAFIEWLESCNHFCNSLVDRIVPGRPDKETLAELEQQLGYSDQLLIMSEAYALWAIEGGEAVKNILSFSQVDAGVVIEPDISVFKELKLRLLNGTHTLSCGLAFLAGFDTVKQAMEDHIMSSFISEVMLNELAPSIPHAINLAEAQNFAYKVLDRFRNPHIRHQWIAITMQYSSKMRMRNLPILLKHYEQYNSSPGLFALGFAAYLAFTQPVKQLDGKYLGVLDGKEYLIQDDAALSYLQRWNTFAPAELVKEVLGDVSLWEHDLNTLPGFYDSVLDKLNLIINVGARKAIESVQSKKVFV